MRVGLQINHPQNNCVCFDESEINLMNYLYEDYKEFIWVSDFKYQNKNILKLISEVFKFKHEEIRVGNLQSFLNFLTHIYP